MNGLLYLLLGFDVLWTQVSLRDNDPRKNYLTRSIFIYQLFTDDCDKYFIVCFPGQNDCIYGIV